MKYGEQTTKEKKCPECGAKMHKAGPAVSGRRLVQRWRCGNGKCLRTTIKD